MFLCDASQNCERRSRDMLLNLYTPLSECAVSCALQFMSTRVSQSALDLLSLWHTCLLRRCHGHNCICSQVPTTSPVHLLAQVPMADADPMRWAIVPAGQSLALLTRRATSSTEPGVIDPVDIETRALDIAHYKGRVRCCW